MDLYHPMHITRMIYILGDRLDRLTHSGDTIKPRLDLPPSDYWGSIARQTSPHQGQVTLYETNLLNSLVTSAVGLLPQTKLIGPVAVPHQVSPALKALASWADIYPRIYTISCCLLFNACNGDHRARLCLCQLFPLICPKPACHREWHLVALQDFWGRIRDASFIASEADMGADRGAAEDLTTKVSGPNRQPAFMLTHPATILKA